MILRKRGKEKISLKYTHYLLMLSLFILVGFSGCGSQGGGATNPTRSSTLVATFTTGPMPSRAEPTATVSGSSSTALEQVATRYYDAIKAQNYPLAYIYLDANATNADGQKIVLSSFEQMAQSMDRQEGPVVSFSAAAYPPMVVMTIARTLLQAYHAHLQMKQEGQVWKIISLDRI